MSLQDGDSTLHVAVCSDSKEVLEVLLEGGADLNVKNDVSDLMPVIKIHLIQGNCLHDLIYSHVHCM